MGELDAETTVAPLRIVDRPREQILVATTVTAKPKRWKTRIFLVALVVACEIVFAHRSGAVRVPGVDRVTGWIQSVASAIGR